MESLIPKHGGFRTLKSFQMSTIVYDLTTFFTKYYVDYHSRTVDQMVQAARSGRQNIAEGCTASGTSKKTELKLIGVARASLEELLLDYEDFLRQNNLDLWEKSDPRISEIRRLAFLENKSYKTYWSYIKPKETAANCIICLIHQTCYLLDQQLKSLEEAFVKEGGFTERLYNFRKQQKGF